MLGKENMVGHWCWQCKLSSSQWQNQLLFDQYWTTVDILKHHKDCTAKELKDKKNLLNVIWGVTLSPTFDQMENHYYIISVLHGLELAVYYVLR